MLREEISNESSDPHLDDEEVRGVHRRRKDRDAGPRQRDEGGQAPRARGQGGRGKRVAREDRRAAGSRSRLGQAAPRRHQSQRARPLAEAVVRHAGVLQGWQGPLPLPGRAEVQDEVRDAWLQRRSEPRRGRPLAGRLRGEGVDGRRRGENRRAREEGGRGARSSHGYMPHMASTPRSYAE